MLNLQILHQSHYKPAQYLKLKEDYGAVTEVESSVTAVWASNRPLITERVFAAIFVCEINVPLKAEVVFRVAASATDQ